MQNTFNEPTATITENNETPSQIQNNILACIVNQQFDLFDFSKRYDWMFLKPTKYL